MQELLSIDDVARRLSVGSTYARELIYSRQIRSVKLGKRRLIASEDVDAFIEKLRAEQRESVA